MAQKTKRQKCRHCGVLFRPDPRSSGRQKYCSRTACRKASKAASQQRWLQKPGNRDYFHGPDHVQRVQRWRKAHPAYWRPKSGNRPHALQDPLMREVSENTDHRGNFVPVALQDSLFSQSAVLIGLIAQFTGSALQDDITMAARRMQQLGNDIFNPYKGGRHGNQTPDLPAAYPQSPQTVPLDRSTAGP